MDEGRLRSWMEGYVRAWETNDPAQIRALFAENARYYTAPWREPWTGREGIVQGWLGRKDEPGGWSFEWKPLLIGDHLAVVTGRTRYRDWGTTYSNLWVVRFSDDGFCTEFTEWWMLEDR